MSMEQSWEELTPKQRQEWDDLAEAMMSHAEYGGLVPKAMQELKETRKRALKKRTSEMTWGAN